MPVDNIRNGVVPSRAAQNAAAPSRVSRSVTIDAVQTGNRASPQGSGANLAFAIPQTGKGGNGSGSTLNLPRGSIIDTVA